MAISSNATGLRPGVCTSTTRPTNPYTGQLIFETDTFTSKFWNGSSWRPAVGALSDATDVTISSPIAGQQLAYDSTSGKWVNATPFNSLGYESNTYYTPSSNTFSGTTSSTVNTLYYAPFLVTEQTTFTQIAVRAGVSLTGVLFVRVGIYANDPTTGRPSTLIVDAGQIYVSFTPGLFTATISQTLKPGWYWLAGVPQSSTGNTVVYTQFPLTPNSRLSSSYVSSQIANAFTETGISGALPSTASGSVQQSSMAILIYMRK